MSVPVVAVDAFADAPFTGNPAAVVFLDAPREDAWLKSVAAEFNLSETAFLVPKDGAWDLRWFTPAVEVPLCGHATLAAAHALWETGRLEAAATARFATRSGELTARRDGEWIAIDLPVLEARAAKPPAGLLSALTDTPLALVETDAFLMLEMDSEDSVRRARPDLARWSALSPKGLVLTAPSRRKTHDCVSRCFFPSDGIPEDPVTGSAHCAIGPYWSSRLAKPVITAYQASARGGTLIVRPRGARVELGGRARTAWRGELA
jgi:predicted PhzF superfamily epimerase YddE/YHI9